jgi:hypothetical protein
MLFREIFSVYSENRAKPVNILSEHNADIYNVETSGK